ncbi:CPCC family cysteine-rich protein [Streptomyces tuirus]|uniref:CPCC family cysteine-rich protein n=1 Tax=Streptomyces tuirus TaxID=68278 RepID=UPI00341A08D0
MTGPRHHPAPPPPPLPPLEELLPCPCCGHRTLGELWAYEICPVCYWEEDPFQLRHPTSGGGPNHGLSLIEAQANYRRIGAVTEEMRRYVRPPRADEPPDPGFRPADPAGTRSRRVRPTTRCPATSPPSTTGAPPTGGGTSRPDILGGRLTSYA